METKVRTINLMKEIQQMCDKEVKEIKKENEDVSNKEMIKVMELCSRIMIIHGNCSLMINKIKKEK